jgi:hypothetical protein
MEVVNVISAFGLSASAGLNTYMPLLIVAVAAKLGAFQLNEPFDVMTNWWIIGVLAVLLVVEILVDKVPAADTINDVIGTVLRPAAGAVLFAASSGIVYEMSPVLAMALGLVVAGSVHATKATLRPAITATTAGVGNPVISTIEDLISAVTSLLAIIIPWLVLLVAVIGIVMVLRWRIRRAERKQLSNP